MQDQASSLRAMTRASGALLKPVGGSCQVIAVTSGKGGVGKTSVVVNLAMALQRSGRRVAIFDADFGLANVDVFMGLTPKLHLGHVLAGTHSLEDILLDGPEGVRLIPASSGLPELTRMDETRRFRLIGALHSIIGQFDYLLIDTAAGISDNVIQFLEISPRVIVVSAPEPAAIVDAYALIKVLHRRSRPQKIMVLVNSVRSEAEAIEVFQQLDGVVRRFLGRELQLLGFVSRDEKLLQAVRRQQPLLVSFPRTLASRCFVRLARALEKTAVINPAGPTCLAEV